MTDTERSHRDPRRRAAVALAAVAAVAAVSALLAVPEVASAAATDVRLAQADLGGLDYPAGAADGIVGPQTQAATSAFQSDRCLSVDGIIGPGTVAELQSVVRAVQTAAGVPADGDYGSATTGAVAAYQGAHGLAVDGIAGPDTMSVMGITRLVDGCHTPSTLGARIAAIAEGEVGTRSDARGCVPGKPYSVCEDWCAAFATWAWRDAGVDIPFEVSVPRVYDWAVAHGRWYGTGQLGLAQPGYLIIFGSANDRYHIGVVENVSGGTVHVVSGNTPNPANSSQWGVYDKAYALSGSVFYGLVHL
jgi:hypothetical protein